MQGLWPRVLAVLKSESHNPFTHMIKATVLYTLHFNLKTYLCTVAHTRSTGSYFLPVHGLKRILARSLPAVNVQTSTHHTPIRIAILVDSTQRYLRQQPPHITIFSNQHHHTLLHSVANPDHIAIFSRQHHHTLHCYLQQIAPNQH